jgi:uncharacterized protein
MSSVILPAGRSRGAVPVFCLREFLRVVTHPRLFDPPSTLDQALAAMDAIVQCRSARIVSPTEGYLALLAECLRHAEARGNLVFDAQIVALCSEHGIERLLTADRDFARFAGLTIVPLSTAPS